MKPYQHLNLAGAGIASPVRYRPLAGTTRRGPSELRDQLLLSGTGKQDKLARAFCYGCYFSRSGRPFDGACSGNPTEFALARVQN
jgi:hypothetical protein